MPGSVHELMSELISHRYIVTMSDVGNMQITLLHFVSQYPYTLLDKPYMPTLLGFLAFTQTGWRRETIQETLGADPETLAFWKSLWQPIEGHPQAELITIRVDNTEITIPKLLHYPSRILRYIVATELQVDVGQLECSHQNFSVPGQDGWFNLISGATFQIIPESTCCCLL
jgi:hypothetical protein